MLCESRRNVVRASSRKECGDGEAFELDRSCILSGWGRKS